MAITTKWYARGLKHLEQGTIDWLNDSIKVALFTSTYVPNQQTDEYYDAPIAGEVASGSGYTTGGVVLASKTITQSALEQRMDAADASWAALSRTSLYAVIYDATPVSNKPLLGYVDFETTRDPEGSLMRIEWDATGILKVVAT